MPVAVDRPARLRVAQDALVIDERLRALVGGQVELDEDPLDVDQVALERVEEAAGLEVLRRCTSTQVKDASSALVFETRPTKHPHRDALVLDDVPDPVALGGDRAEAKQAQRRVPAVRRGEDRPVEDEPSVVRENRRQRRPVPPRAAPARGHARRRRRPLVLVDDRHALALPLQQTIQRIQVPKPAVGTSSQQ